MVLILLVARETRDLLSDEIHQWLWPSIKDFGYPHSYPKAEIRIFGHGSFPCRKLE